jgi:hypothetical protein
LYDSFYKAVMGEGVWKETCNNNTRRLGTMIAEAYTLTMVSNHYFAWLYEFKANNPNTSIKTAYDHQVSEPTNQGDEQLIEMFCGIWTWWRCQCQHSGKPTMTVVPTQKKRIKGQRQQDCWSSNSCWRRARQQMPTRKLRIMTNGF